MVKTLLKHHQLLKWFLIMVAGFIIVLGSVAVYLNFRLKPILALQLKTLVAGATQNLYRVEFSGIRINCITGDASLRNVRLIPDTAVLRQLIAKKAAPNNIYHIQLNKLSILNVHPWKVYREKKLNIDRIEINRPTITMVNKQYGFNEDKPPRPLISPYEMVSRFLQEVRVNKIEFRDASFQYIDRNGQRPVVSTLDHFHVTLEDWLIDAHSATDTSRFYLLKDVFLQLDNYQHATADSLYFLQANTMNFRASTGVLDVKRLSLIPRYSEMDFGKRPGAPQDRFSLEIHELSFAGINLPLYIKRREFVAREMDVKQGRIAVFYNREIPQTGTPGPALFPHQQLQQLAAKLSIQKLNLHHFDVSYTEYNPERKEKGRITFERTSGLITNITNVTHDKEKNPIMEAKLRTYLMGQGELHTHFNFNLLAKNGAFDYSGTLYGFNGTVLNSITKPLGMVHIKSGKVKKLVFAVKANANRAQGDMTFLYQDLAIAVLKKEKGKSWYSRQGLLSFLANNLIIKPDHPDHLGRFSKANMDYQRKPNSSFFSFIWKTLFQGIRFSVGVTPQKEALMKAHIARFESMKLDREKRKAARERRKGKSR